MPNQWRIHSIRPETDVARIARLQGDLGDFSQLADFASNNPAASIYFLRMQDKIQKQILDAFFVVLRPIAKILLRYGIGFREFTEVAKTAFVDVATAEYGIRGRPTNISRVAVMTGLTRKEVRRLRDQIESGSGEISVKTTPMTRVLHKWHSDSDFLGEDGRPEILPFAGKNVSFTALVKRYGGDIPPGAMRTELKRVKAIEESDDGMIRAIRRDVHPRVEHENLCVALMHSAYPLLSNIAHNTNPDLRENTWAQMTAFTAQIRESDIKRLRRICSDRAKEAVEAYDDLFMAYETLNEDNAKKEETRPVAVGVFYFEEREKKFKKIWATD